jgi:hypothetical protein
MVSETDPYGHILSFLDQNSKQKSNKKRCVRREVEACFKI